MDPKKQPSTEAELKEQTIKWLDKLETEVKGLESTGKLDEKQYNELVTNMKAYIKDARHFIDKKDWVRAFEAVIYAWGILDTSRRCGIIRVPNKEPVRDATSDK